MNTKIPKIVWKISMHLRHCFVKLSSLDQKEYWAGRLKSSGILHRTHWQILPQKSLEISANTHQPTRVYTPEYLKVQQFLSENLKSLNIHLF